MRIILFSVRWNFLQIHQLSEICRFSSSTVIYENVYTVINKLCHTLFEEQCSTEQWMILPWVTLRYVNKSNTLCKSLPKSTRLRNITGMLSTVKNLNTTTFLAHWTLQYGDTLLYTFIEITNHQEGDQRNRWPSQQAIVSVISTPFTIVYLLLGSAASLFVISLSRYH